MMLEVTFFALGKLSNIFEKVRDITMTFSNDKK